MASAYADDTVFIAKSHNIYHLERSCNNDLDMIERWCMDNKMVINTKKSHFLLCNALKFVVNKVQKKKGRGHEIDYFLF